MTTADCAVTRPLPFVVTWQTCVASPQPPGAELTVASVVAPVPPVLVTSPVRPGALVAARTPVTSAVDTFTALAAESSAPEVMWMNPVPVGTLAQCPFAVEQAGDP